MNAAGTKTYLANAAGRTKMSARLLTVLVMVLFLGGATCQQVNPPPAVPECSTPEALNSVICAIATRQGYTPEQIDSMFLDAALAGIGTKIISAKELRAALQNTRQWVGERDILNVQGLTSYLVKQAEVDPALAMLLSRRLGLINVPILSLAPLTPYDKALILAGIDHQLAQLAWF
jgi:hypothetical protein